MYWSWKIAFLTFSLGPGWWITVGFASHCRHFIDLAHDLAFSNSREWIHTAQKWYPCSFRNCNV